MNRTAISIYHGRKGAQRSPISFSFPEPSPEQVVSKTTSGDGEQSWQCTSLGSAGIGLFLSYRQYRIMEPTTFILEPSEPVACLRLTHGDGSTIGFKGGKLLSATETPLDHIFWMGNRTMEFTLQPGDHFHLDLLIRPECLSHLSDRSQIMEIIDSSLDGEPSDPLGIPLFTEKLKGFVGELMGELDRGKPTAERFAQMCDCLILKCLGEDVEIPKVNYDPIEEDDLPTEEEQRRYHPTPEQQTLLDSMSSTGREGLEKRYLRVQRNLMKLKRIWKRLRRKIDLLSLIRSQEQSRTNGKYADLLMKAARFMAENNNLEGLEKQTKTLLRRAIGRCCTMAFSIRPPSIEEMDLCCHWTGRPIDLGQFMDTGSPADLLSLFFPGGALDTEPDTDPIHGEGLLLEQIRETFGFRRPSELAGRKDDDRPLEVVQTYNRLVERFTETLTAGEDGVTRSNLIRKLDAAFENDDLVALLQLEAESLGSEQDFLKEMDDDRLRYTVMAIEMERMEYLDLISDIEMEPGCTDMLLLKDLGNDLKRFRRAVSEEYSVNQDRYTGLMETMKKTEGNISIANLKELAKFVLTGKIK